MDPTARLARLRRRLARVPPALLLAPLLALGLRPYAELLRLWPLTTDSALWVARGSLDNPNWLGWALARPHFVFYRPVAALSYTLSDALGGIDGIAYRGTDVLLHGAVALLVYALYRELVGDRRGWAALTATAFFLVHPVGEEVVPFLARRGYLLMTGFGAASVWVFARACRRGRGAISGATGASALLLAASLLATEVDFALLPLYPLLALHLAGGWPRPPWRALARAALPLLAGAAVYAGRLAMLGDVGGYSRVRSGWDRFWHLMPDAVSYPLFPSSATGQPAWLPLGGVEVALLVAYLAWRAALAPLGRLDRPRERVSLVLVAWLFGTLALPALFGVWFYRHTYPLLVPLSLLVAKIAADTLARLREARGGRRWLLALHGLPLLALLASVLHYSPVVRGLDPRYTASRRVLDDRMRQLVRDLARVEEPAVVYLILPFEPPQRIDPGWDDPGTYAMRRTGIWAQARTRGRDLELRDLVYVGPDPDGAPLGPTRPLQRGGRPVIQLPPGVPLRFTGSWVVDQPELPLLRLDRLPLPEGRRGYVYYFDGETGRLLPLAPAA